MVLAEVNLGDLILTAIWVFFLILFIWLFIAIVSDVFRDHELSGVTKALWVIGLILFPLIGALVYLIVRGSGMAQRTAARERLAQSQVEGYIREVAGTPGAAPVDDLARLSELRRNGTITDAEFESIKSRIVAGSAAGTRAGVMGGTTDTSGGAAAASPP
ncbi:MAG: SHOCT domain-containing protein [Acidimicrobiia bacterium]